jgi:hypothetical protein
MNFLESSSFRELDDFPLRWRWTDEKWNVLPDEALKSIRPYTDLGARKILEFSLKFGDAKGLFRSHFEKVERFKTNVDSTLVTKWLRKSISSQPVQVVVSWDHHHAVLVDWNVFCEYWDDFCYPSSDDVAILPTDMKWVLFYFHDEHFELGLAESISE